MNNMYIQTELEKNEEVMRKLVSDFKANLEKQRQTNISERIARVESDIKNRQQRCVDDTTASLEKIAKVRTVCSYRLARIYDRAEESIIKQFKDSMGLIESSWVTIIKGY